MKIKNSNVMTLVVDLDNTLLKIDLFKEELGISLLKRPWKFIIAVLLGLKNRAKSKIYISKHANIDYSKLPFNNKVISLISKYRNDGHQVVLATGASKTYANNIAKYLGIFDKVISTVHDINNIGKNKLKFITREVNGDFIYVGDSKNDLPIWRHCKKAILVGNNKTVLQKLKADGIEIIDIINENKSYVKLYFREIRLYQWVKNTIIFIPAIASHQLLQPTVFANSLQAFFAMSLIASGIYIFNDILDINYDRNHPNKSNRPIAAGDLSIFSGYSLLAICFFVGLYIAFKLGNSFLMLACVYIILNLFYTYKWKNIIILDVILLMSFYTIRLIAGQIPNKILFSPWLLSFSIFIFFSLAILKRFVDIKIAYENDTSKIKDKGYELDDCNILMTMGVGSGLISILVLILYTSSLHVQKLYETPLMLIAIAPLMLFWTSNIWFKAYKGQIKEDPVLFVIKDKKSYIIAFLMFLVVTISTFKL